MDRLQKHFLGKCRGGLRHAPRLFALAALIPIFAATAPTVKRFYPDDPLWTWPQPLPLKEPKALKINQLYDFVINSVAPPGEKQLPGHIIPAAAVNTLDEVPDSLWYTNRHYRNRMTIEELRRGPARGKEPVGPFQVVGAKNEGITPGFQLLDSKGRRYLCKPDPISNPDMATAADVIGSKFFYAFGYNVPENYILYFRPEEISISPKAKVTPRGGKERPMNPADLQRVFDKMPKDSQGRYRVMASFFIEGKGLGPFRYYGTRPDDPNDTVPHEHRRDLRGLHVFCAWLNHTDAKAGNTYDSLVDVNGIQAIRHYLIDFGASLGSDSDEAKDARLGHEYMIETDNRVLIRMFSLGLYSPDWERANYSNLREVGRFTAEAFHPNRWTSNYPNSAFINRLPDDTFWAAKQVMAFTDAEIRAMVETGQYTDPRTVEYLTKTLTQRRDAIGREFFSQVLPLDRFEVRDGELRFTDLSVAHKFITTRAYDIQWFRFDNNSGARTPIAGASGPRVPGGFGAYAVAAIRASGGSDKQIVSVYIRGNNGSLEVVGVDRAW